MTFRIQHPVSGLFWDVDSDSKLTLSASGAVYEMEGDHIHNTATGMCLYADGNNGVHERGHYGAGTLFEWSVTDGVISNIYIDKSVDENLSLGTSGFAWSVVQPATSSRAEALLEEAQSAPEPESEPAPEPESEPAPESA
jgi:hypothetical protein